MSRWFFFALLLLAAPLSAEPKPYRLPAVELKERVIWGSSATTPEGFTLSFGGLDQDADDGRAHTRVRLMEEIDLPTRQKSNDPLLDARSRASTLHKRIERIAASSRSLYFNRGGGFDNAFDLRDGADLILVARKAQNTFRENLTQIHASLKGSPAAQAEFALACLIKAEHAINAPGDQLTAENVRDLHRALPLLEQTTDALDVEPSARALSPLVYDHHTKVFVLFGGDHLDFLLNDLWVFDPESLLWEQRHPPKSPAPRANHQWKVLGDGRLELTGGYHYASSTDYMGGQYIDHDDGPWIYDIAKNAWSGDGELGESDLRVYRTGPFHPDYFLQGDPPDAAAFQKTLAELPANRWVATKPPYLPQMNRDWGSAVLAGDAAILRWSGGHCAHGGTDVLHYHIATNRWELPRPVEFPLGQLYTNTEYPRGVSFNGQAWITGHTYQSHGFLQESNQMLFVGQRKQTFIYDPAVASWRTHVAPKPEGMNYDSSFYTLTLCSVPGGVVCWTKDGRVFHGSKNFSNWHEWKLTGDKLPGSEVDNSTLVYDAKRNRLYFFRKPYGDKVPYDGLVYSLELESKQVTKIEPANAAAAAKVLYLCQIRYHADSDLLIAGCTLPPGDDGLRRTPAYDPENNRWLSLAITGDDPSGKTGRNVSLGMMYDAKRKLLWAVDAASRVFVLRIDRSTADVQPLE